MIKNKGFREVSFTQNGRSRENGFSFVTQSPYPQLWEISEPYDKWILNTSFEMDNTYWPYGGLSQVCSGDTFKRLFLGEGSWKRGL